MEKKRSSGKQPAQQANVHPETQHPVKPGVADDSSSKAKPNQKQHDARTGHDKDGNDQQARTDKQQA